MALAQNIPFSDYDFWGYLSAGFLLLYVVDSVIGTNHLTKDSWTVVEGVIAFSAAYAVGHLTAGVSSFTLTFLAGAALGSYVQTMTGFAQGIVVTGVVALSDAAAIAETADALSIIGIINAAVVLPKMWKHINWPSLLRIMIALTPGMIAGVVLLDILSSHHSTLLRLLAGLIVLMGGATLFLQPRPAERPSGPVSTGILGVTAGVMSGLFSLPGPPVVYHYYRQPVSLQTVRATLIAIFAILSAFRLMAVSIQTEISTVSIQLALMSVPVVAAGSWLGVRFPPRLSDAASRRAAFAILTGMGFLTILMALRDLLPGDVP